MHDEHRTRSVTWQDPARAAGAARTMSGLQRLQAVMRGDLPASPLALLLGLRLVSVERGRVIFEADVAEYHYNLGGVAHGGLACAIMDSALGCAVTSLLPAGQSCATSDLHVRFLRPLTVALGTVRCEADVLHLGRTLAAAEARLTDSAGRLCAHATAACVLQREADA